MKYTVEELVRANERYLALTARHVSRSKRIPAVLEEVEEEGGVVAATFETAWPHGFKDGDLIAVDDARGVVYALSPTRFVALLSERLGVGRYKVARVSPDFLSALQLEALKRLREPRSEHQSRFAELLRGATVAPLEPEDFEPANEELNEAQREAVGKSLAAVRERDFFLVHGPPGTGKTTVISELMAQLARSGYRVLVCSNTNVAVDNALERLLELEPDAEELAVRVGDATKVSKEVKRRVRVRRRIGVITASTLSHLSILYASRKLDWDFPWFDACIVDEASMATLPLTLCGVLAAKSFILVGDHKQLPPVVEAAGLTQKEARLVSTSPFELLIVRYPQRSTLLDVQYRCHPAIMAFPSQYIYGGRLKSHPSTRWKVIATEAGTPLGKLLGGRAILWLDTAGHAYSWVGGRRPSAVNVYEAALASAVVLEHVAQGIDIERQCVITPYRAQSFLIRRVLAQLTSEAGELDVFDMVELASSTATVEQFQGRERDVVVFSAVHSSALARALLDERKINVAITRASRRLVIVASSTLAAYGTLFSHLYTYIKRLGGLARAPPISKLGRAYEVARREARALSL